MATESKTEYGIRYSNGEIEWQDGDGDVFHGGNYYSPRRDDHRGFAALLRDLDSDETLVQRVYTPSEVTAYQLPLPTTPGSVISAKFNGQPGLFALSDDTDALPWLALTRLVDVRWVESVGLQDVKVLFDAGTVA